MTNYIVIHLGSPLTLKSLNCKFIKNQNGMLLSLSNPDWPSTFYWLRGFGTNIQTKMLAFWGIKVCCVTQCGGNSDSRWLEDSDRLSKRKCLSQGGRRDVFTSISFFSHFREQIASTRVLQERVFCDTWADTVRVASQWINQQLWGFLSLVTLFLQLVFFAFSLRGYPLLQFPIFAFAKLRLTFPDVISTSHIALFFVTLDHSQDLVCLTIFFFEFFFPTKWLVFFQWNNCFFSIRISLHERAILQI